MDSSIRYDSRIEHKETERGACCRMPYRPHTQGYSINLAVSLRSQLFQRRRLAAEAGQVDLSKSLT
jgi:hypothetical protein